MTYRSRWKRMLYTAALFPPLAAAFISHFEHVDAPEHRSGVELESRREKINL
jgi:hypothetical protein